LKIGSLESDKIIIESLESEKIESLQGHTRYLAFSCKKSWPRTGLCRICHKILHI